MRIQSMTYFALLLGCSDSCGNHASTNGSDASVSSVTAITSAQVGADASEGPHCRLDGEVAVVDKVIRTDAGLTIVTLPDGRIAVGYAGAKGQPQAAIYDSDGKASTLEVEASAVSEVVKPTQRVIQRVTPLGFMDAGLKMRVALDVLDIAADKSQSLRCGPADEPAFTATDVDPEMKDCRTFSDGSRTFVLASEVHDDTVRWRIDTKAGDEPIESTLLHDAKFTAEKLTKETSRYLYQVPVAAFLPGTGALLASREDGGLVLARRDASLAAFGKPVRFWLGAATTMPALSIHEHDAFAFIALQNQRDLYGSAFVLEAKDIPKPEKITLADSNPAIDGDRTSVTSSVFPKGDVLVGFADGRPGSKRARVTVLSKDMKSLVPVVDLANDVTELHVTATADGAAIMTFIGKQNGALALLSAKISCRY